MVKTHSPLGDTEYIIGGSKLHKTLEEHLLSEEHRQVIIHLKINFAEAYFFFIQREIVFYYYLDFARIKGFNWEKDVDAKNLKFFLTVLQAKAVHENITQICCLSALSSSLEISPSLYGSLYKHIDNLIR